MNTASFIPKIGEVRKLGVEFKKALICLKKVPEISEPKRIFIKRMINGGVGIKTEQFIEMMIIRGNTKLC